MNQPRVHGGIDRISFLLGMINCFVEMVAVGVKRLALSPPVTPDDYEKIRSASDRIVQEFGIQSYLEKSLIVTDLQSEAFTRGKWSILYFRTDDVLQKYLDLKAMKKKHEEEGSYDAECRRNISRIFMELLSYPPDTIEKKLRGRSADPFMLIEL